MVRPGRERRGRDRVSTASITALVRSGQRVLAARWAVHCMDSSVTAWRRQNDFESRPLALDHHGGCLLPVSCDERYTL